MRKHEMKALIKHLRKRVHFYEAALAGAGMKIKDLKKEIEEQRESYHWLNCELTKANDKLKVAGIVEDNRVPTPEADEARRKAVWLNRPPFAAAPVELGSDSIGAMTRNDPSYLPPSHAYEHADAHLSELRGGQ